MRKYQRFALWVAAPLAFASGCANGPGLFSSSRHGRSDDDAAKRMVQAAESFDQHAAQAPEPPASPAAAPPLKPNGPSRRDTIAQSKQGSTPEVASVPVIIPEKKSSSITQGPSNWEELRAELLLDGPSNTAAKSAVEPTKVASAPEAMPASALPPKPEAFAAGAEKSDLPIWALSAAPQPAAAPQPTDTPQPTDIPKPADAESGTVAKTESSTPAISRTPVKSTPTAAPAPEKSATSPAPEEWVVEVHPAGTPRTPMAPAVVAQVAPEQKPHPKNAVQKPKSSTGSTDTEVFPEDAGKLIATKEDWTKTATREATSSALAAASSSQSVPAREKNAVDRQASIDAGPWAQTETPQASAEEHLAFTDDSPFAPPVEVESPVNAQPELKAELRPSPFVVSAAELAPKAAPVESKVGQSDSPDVWARVIAQTPKKAEPELDQLHDLPAWAVAAEIASNTPTAGLATDASWTRTSIDRLCPDLSPELLPIVDQLGHRDSATKLAALAELADRGDKAASADLAVRILLDDADPVVRAHAAATLRVIKHDAWDSVKTLRLLIFHPDPEVAKLVCYLLRGVGPEAMDAAPELRTLRDSKRGLVSLHAAEALLEITPHDAQSVSILTTASQAEGSEERVFAASALGQVGSIHRDVAAGALAKALKDESVDVRAAAALSLGGLGSAAAPAKQALLQIAENDVPEVQEAAKVALACLGN